MRRRTFSSLNQSGQALIEYIALLIISILVIGGIVYQFNDAFKQYMQAWFRADEGGYLFCLIQNGYLPGESETCPLPSFNLQNGKKLFANGIGGVGGSGANGGGSGKGGGNGLNGLSANEGGSGGRGLVPYNSSGGLGGSDKNAAGAGKKGSETSKGSTGDDGFSSAGGPFGGQGSNQTSLGFGGRSRSIPIDEKFGSGKVKGTESIPVTERDLTSPRFVAAEKARRKHIEDQGIDTDFSFGKILKYLFIIILCFSIFFFIGSQLLAISRGNKKRN